MGHVPEENSILTMEDNWVLLITCGSPSEAAIREQKLARHGITCILLNKRDSAYGLFGPIEVYCHLTQAHAALELLENEDE